MAITDSQTSGDWSPWVRGWTMLSVPGLCVAALTWGLAGAAAAAIAVAVPVALVLAMTEQARWQERGQPAGEARARARRISRVALCAALLVISLAVATAIAPGLALLLLVAAGGTTPPATDLCRRMLGASPGRAAPHASRPSSPGSAAATQDMTDTELCRAWRQSYWTLRETRDPLTREAVVRQRQCLLDELEVRDAGALEAWLASGARPSGGPERFLRDHGDGGEACPTAA